MSSDASRRFINWFQSNNAFFDEPAISLVAVFGQGYGAIALKDLSEGHTLFTIPRSLTLSTRTSMLPSLLTENVWKRYQLNRGWVGLILCMMWEEAQGSSSKWSDYLAFLPKTFDTPMFWNAADLEELKGTSVLEKLGKEDAERDYREKLLPAVSARPDLFPVHLIGQYYSLEQYHIVGSRILSRSFCVDKWGEGDECESDGENRDGMGNAEEANTSAGSGMDVDDEISAGGDDNGTDNSDYENIDDPSDIAMVPMADMLNARFRMENAKLFHEEHTLKMITTKPIAAGEQIYNTYGDLPNSELLRRYGHVDLLPLPQGKGEGNPGDVVEIRADIVIGALSHPRVEACKERIEWWLEEGGDDTFFLEFNLILPDLLLSFVRLLILSQDEWEKAKVKGKLPKPKTDGTILAIVLDVLKKRLELYPTTIQTDEELLESSNVLSLNKRHAVIVRLGEKRILSLAMEEVQHMLDDKRDEGNVKIPKRKGVEDNSSAGQGKRSRLRIA